MATLGSLIISLEANTAKFESAMNKAQYTAKKSADAIKGAFLGIGAGIAAAISIGSIISAVEEVAKMEGALLKMAGRLNTSVETLSSFGVMIRKTGMDSDSFYTALTRLEKGMSAAAAKTEISTGKFDENGEEIMKASSTYNELGINVDKLIKLPLEMQLKAIAEGFKNNIDPADRVRIAMELFGKTGAGMVNILKGGAADIEKWIKQQEDLGIITTDAAKKSSEFNNAVADLTTQWATFKREILEGVIPALVSLLTAINDVIRSWKEFRQYHIDQGNLKQLQMQQAPKITRLSPESAGKIQLGQVQAGPMGMQIPPVPDLPASDLFKKATRPGDILKGAKGGGGGGGKGGSGGDMGLDRMTSIIDTLQKDLSRLTEGSLAEIRDWANKMRTEIEKVGRKGADTSKALSMVTDVEAAKKKKAEDDYYLFVAKESGDNYKQIEADAKDWLNKYKGFQDAEKNVALIKTRKIAEEDSKQQSDRLNLQKSFLESITSEMPLLSKQLEMRKKILPIELEINRLELERKMNQMRLTEDQKNELRSLKAVEDQAKKYNLTRAEWAKQGTVGGLKIGTEELKKGAETWAAEQTAALVKSLPATLSNEIANSLIGFLQGKTPDLQQLGISMAESFLQKMLEGILNQIIPKMLEGLGSGLESIMGDILGAAGGGGGGGGFLGDIIGGIGGFLGFLHGGGVIRAHRGWPLRSDEVPIIAQTGERVLSRAQNQAYEAGMSGGPTNVHVYLPNQSQVEIDRFARRLHTSLRRQEGRRIA